MSRECHLGRNYLLFDIVNPLYTLLCFNLITALGRKLYCSTLQVGKLRLREVMYCAQGHTGGRCQIKGKGGESLGRNRPSPCSLLCFPFLLAAQRSLLGRAVWTRGMSHHVGNASHSEAAKILASVLRREENFGAD